MKHSGLEVRKRPTSEISIAASFIMKHTHHHMIFLPGLPLHITLAKHMQLASADASDELLQLPLVPTANERAPVMGL